MDVQEFSNKIEFVFLFLFCLPVNVMLVFSPYKSHLC